VFCILNTIVSIVENKIHYKNTLCVRVCVCEPAT